MLSLLGLLSALVTVIFVVVPSGSDCQNHYQMLGVARDASTSDIRKAYHRHSLIYHPDKARGVTGMRWATKMYRLALLWKPTQEVFIDLSNAYETLSDGERRTTHDTELADCEQHGAAQEAERRMQRQSMRATPWARFGPGPAFAVLAAGVEWASTLCSRSHAGFGGGWLEVGCICSGWRFGWWQYIALRHG